MTAARHSYEVAANWKILVENYHECYHCSSIHPELCKVSPPKSGEDHEARGIWFGGSMELEDHAETMSLTGESFAPMLPHLTALQEREVYYYQLFPNLLISLHPDYVMTHRLRPLAPDRTAVECEWLFSKEAVESEGFDPSYASEFWDITNGQDWGACEGVQRGASSRGYRQGPLSPDESTSGKFVATVARGYLEGGVTQMPDWIPPERKSELDRLERQRSRLPGVALNVFAHRFDEGVDRHAPARADDDRVDVEGADEVPEVPGQQGEPRKSPGQRVHVRRWRAPDPVEQRTGVEPVDKLRGPRLVQGRQGETPVAERLDQYAAGGDHHQRAELGVCTTPSAISTPGSTISCTVTAGPRREDISL